MNWPFGTLQTCFRREKVADILPNGDFCLNDKLVFQVTLNFRSIALIVFQILEVIGTVEWEGS